MKSSYIKLLAFLLLVSVVGCQQDKKEALAKLKKERDELTVKIKNLEAEIAAKDTSKDNSDKLKQVAVINLQAVKFQHFIEVQGRLDGEQNLDVYPEAMGVVESVLVTNGQSVSQGQVLARLNDAAAKEQLKSLETNYKFAKDAFEKQERLWNQKIGTEMQYLQSKTQKESLEAQMAGVKKQLDMMAVKSPINGTVEDVALKIGQAASPSFPAFRVMNFGSTKIKADVAEAYAQRIKQGDEVMVFFPDLNTEVSSKVTTASRYINPINRTFLVESRLSGTTEGVKANMVAVMKIVDYESAKAFVIPVNYIQSDPTGNYVYVLNENGKKVIAKKAYIKQGQSYNGNIEILEGLKAGDKVISSGYLDLEEGQEVKL